MTVDAVQLPRKIAVGETFDLTCHLDLYQTDSSFGERIKLHFGDSPNSQTLAQIMATSAHSQMIRIEGHALPPLPEAVDLGAFSPPIRRVIPMRKLHRLAKVTIASVDSTNSSIHAAVVSDGLEITIDKAPLGLSVLGRLRVAYRGGTLSAEEVTVHGVASGGLVAKPEKVIFGLLHHGQSATTREIQIESVDGRPFRLTRAVFNQDHLSVELIHQSDSQTLCRITMNPLHPMRIEETLTLVTADGRRGLILPCLGMVE